MSDQPEPGSDEADANLTELQSRLEELQETVRRLGSEEGPPPRVAAMPPTPPPEPEPEPEPAEADEKPDPAPPAATNGHTPAATNGHTPAATNGHTTHSVDPAEISALSSSVAIVDAGHFADLIELRHFEEDLAALAAVRDVRVRRFGQGRATIEVGMTGAYDLGTEIPRLSRVMQVADGPEGEIVVELAEPEPQADAAEADDEA